jgi:hypothetical protein
MNQIGQTSGTNKADTAETGVGFLGLQTDVSRQRHSRDLEAMHLSASLHAVQTRIQSVGSSQAVVHPLGFSRLSGIHDALPAASLNADPN